MIPPFGSLISYNSVHQHTTSWTMIYIHGDSKQPISNTFFVNKYTTRDCYFSFQQCYFFFRFNKKSILAYWDLWDSFELKKGGWSIEQWMIREWVMIHLKLQGAIKVNFSISWAMECWKWLVIEGFFFVFLKNYGVWGYWRSTSFCCKLQLLYWGVLLKLAKTPLVFRSRSA